MPGLSSQGSRKEMKRMRETKSMAKKEVKRMRVTKSMAKKNVGKVMVFIFRLLFSITMCYIILKPFVSLILSAFMSPSDLLDIRVEKVPIKWSLYYWKGAWEGLGWSTAGRNSFITAAGVSVLQVLTSVCVGYGLSRFKFKGSRLLMAGVILTMLIPFQVYSISEYLLFRYFPIFGNLINTPWAIFLLSASCLGLKHGVYIYIVKTFFDGLPKEIEEAAYIDGAGIFKTFTSVMLPNMRNVITTIFLLSFAWQWTDTEFTGHLNNEVNTLASRVTSTYMTMYTTKSSQDMLGTVIAQGAAVILIIVPLVVLYIFCQRSLMQSVSRTGLAN